MNTVSIIALLLPCVLGHHFFRFVEPNDGVYGMEKTLLARASPDEGSVTNQAYVWGLTSTTKYLYFGTVANPACMVAGVEALSTGIASIPLDPITVPGIVTCQFSNSSYAQDRFPDSPYAQAVLGDWRPPTMWRLLKEQQPAQQPSNTRTTRATTTAFGTPTTSHGTSTTSSSSKKLKKITPKDVLVNDTIGIRAAMANKYLVILAGPSLSTVLGGNKPAINLFAWNAETNKYVGSRALIGYSNIRSCVTLRKVVYCGVETTETNDQNETVSKAGAVLRWKGTLANPFAFEVVGELTQEAANLALHEGRIFVTTWPSDYRPFQLYMSPVVPKGGLKPAHKAQWKPVWNAGLFEPDANIPGAYAGGPLRSFGGYLYWGDMHLPFISLIMHPAPFSLEKVVATWRSANVYRAKKFVTSGNGSAAATDVRLIYGNEKLAVWHDDTSEWKLEKNLLGQAPLFGPSGFGNPLNLYVWSMEVFDESLFIGSFDMSFAIELVIDAILQRDLPLGVQLLAHWAEGIFENIMGADLVRIDSASEPGSFVSINGLGNIYNYGVRNMIADNGVLYVGTANNANLNKNGGWELIKLTPEKDPDNNGGRKQTGGIGHL